MADKEERYVLVKIPVKDRKYECPFYYVSEGIEFCNIDESWCEKCQAGMTRSEIVEKIAKAMCGDDFLVEGYYQLAERVLNALMEKTK